MSAAIEVMDRVPFFGNMFKVEDNELNPVNAWPSLMSMTAFVWFVIAAILGLSMPAIQFLDLGTNLYYQNITLHGAAMAFPFAFQLMVAMSLHRAGACLGKRADDIYVWLFYVCMNVGSLLLTVAVLMGFHVTYTVMFPLPIVGATMGQWSMEALTLGFTGIALVLTSMIFIYPIKILKMSFFERTDETLKVAERTLKDPGMVGMIMGVLVLLITGTPLMIVAGSLLLHLYGIFPESWIGWAADPIVFEFVFYIFAHNLMEAMAVMIIGAVYATLPLCLADGARKLYSDKIALLALWILLVTSLTSFFHHFFTMYPALPSTFAYHGDRRGIDHLHDPRDDLEARHHCLTRVVPHPGRLRDVHHGWGRGDRDQQRGLELQASRHDVGRRARNGRTDRHQRAVDGRALLPLSADDQPHHRRQSGAHEHQVPVHLVCRSVLHLHGGRSGRHAAQERGLGRRMAHLWRADRAVLPQPDPVEGDRLLTGLVTTARSHRAGPQAGCHVSLQRTGRGRTAWMNSRSPAGCWRTWPGRRTAD